MLAPPPMGKPAPPGLELVWWILRLRRVIYLLVLALVVWLGIYRDGYGGWLETAIGVGITFGCAGFMEGMYFQQWIERRHDAER